MKTNQISFSVDVQTSGPEIDKQALLKHITTALDLFHKEHGLGLDLDKDEVEGFTVTVNGEALTGVTTTIPPAAGVYLLTRLHREGDLQLVPQGEGDPMKFDVWIDGHQTAHQVQLDANGSWKFQTFVVA
jgi:hypothetical protein